MAYDQELADRIRALIGGAPGLTEKKMFGGLAFLIGGHMAVAASSQGGAMIRVGAEEPAELVASTRARLVEMRGRPMTGWLRVESADLGTDEQLSAWVDRGVGYARSLPPKPLPALAAAVQAVIQRAGAQPAWPRTSPGNHAGC